MAPLFAIQFYKLPKGGFVKLITKENFKLMFGLAMALFIWVATFYVALEYTSLAHAYLFNNMHSAIIVIGRLVMRKPVLKMEILGTFLAFVGGGITLIEQSGSGDSTNIFIGDAIAFCGAIGGVLYFVLGTRLRSNVPLYIYMLPVTFVNGICNLILSFIVEDTSFSADTVDTHPFGWLSAQWIGAGIYLGLVTVVLGMILYIALLKFLPSLVISVAMLSEPVIGTILGIILGVSSIPDPYTIIGSAVLIGGTVIVTVAASKKQIQEEQTKLETTTTTTTSNNNNKNNNNVYPKQKQQSDSTQNFIVLDHDSEMEMEMDVIEGSKDFDEYNDEEAILR